LKDKIVFILKEFYQEFKENMEKSTHISDQNNEFHEVVDINRIYCCSEPQKKDIIEEIVKMKLKCLFPNHLYFIFYRFQPMSFE